MQGLLDRLEGVKQTGKDRWTAFCPVHENPPQGHAPSLSVSRGEDGRALAYCHSCGKEATGAILAAIGLTDAGMFPQDGPRPPREATPKARRRQEPKKTFPTAEDAIAELAGRVKGKHVATWSYPGDTFRVARFDLPEIDPETGKPKKTFRPIHRNGTGWAIGDPAGPLPLYRGDTFDGAGPIVVGEGEKTVDAAVSVGLAAVTSAHGAGAASKTDWQPLAGREIVILPDHDDAGQKYAGEVTDILMKLSPPATVRVVDLPGLDGHGDFADWIGPEGPMGCRDTAEIKAAVLDMARAAPVWTPQDAGPSGSVVPVLTCLADVKPEPVRWLWPRRIALGKLTLLVGDPGLGKSFITLDMAARISRGTFWPDCPDVANPVGGVVLLSAEDDLADTIRPRLDAAGADVRRIMALEAVRVADVEGTTERQIPFDLAADLDALEDAIRQTNGCRLVVLDPITAYLGRTDSHKNAEVRGLLAPLSDLARRYGVAVVAVTHLRKGDGPAMYRAMGSLAFVAAARAAFAVCRDRDDLTGRRRFVLPIKNNIGNDETGLAYRLEARWSANAMPVVQWEAEPVEVSVDDVLAFQPSKNPGPDPTERDEAAEWLQDALTEGPQPSKELLARAKKDGISEGTLKRAKRELGVRASKDGWEGGWTWRLSPDANEGAGHAQTQITCAPSEEPAPLRENKGLTGEGPRADSTEGDEGAQVPECRETDPPPRALDPDQPGPIDLLTPEQRQRYLAIYHSRSASMSSEEKHRRAWRVATTRQKKKE